MDIHESRSEPALDAIDLFEAVDLEQIEEAREGTTYGNNVNVLVICAILHCLGVRPGP